MSAIATHRGVPVIDWEQARAIARDGARTPQLAVARDLSEALGHALAEPLTAVTDLPSFDTSAMDGWEVADPGPWRLCGSSVLAGCQPEPLAGGTAVRVATGARLPPGATAVLRREDGEVGTLGAILHDRSTRALKRGRDARPRGQECRRGEPLLPLGLPGNPQAAVAGAATLAVPLLRRLGGHAYRRPQAGRRDC